MKKVKLIVIGAGQRGAEAYAPYALDNANEVEIVGVADPREDRKNAMVELYNIPKENTYSDWKELLDREKFADGIIIATQDKMHYEPAMAAMEKGYHVLCEKPMSPDAKECIEMGLLAKKHNRILSICHVLRYTPFFSEIKGIIDSGKIGDVMAIQLIENVAYWHQAHSYVRGNWRREDEGSPMIMAKSCHDMDIILWLMNAKCTDISSYGALTHFKKENAPQGATERCLDGCTHKHECPYYAPKIYVDWKDSWQADVIRKVVTLDTTTEGLLKALKEGPYGRCVYHCDNDVVDHQVVNMNFENGAVASFTMCGFTYEEGRNIKVMGTKGEIRGWADKNYIEWNTYLEKNTNTITVSPSGGHMGGDTAIMRDFVQMIANGGKAEGKTSAAVSVESHLMALAAEKSRKENRSISMEEFVKEYQ